MTAMGTAACRTTRTDVVCLLGIGLLALVFWGSCIFGAQVPVAGVYQRHFAPYNASGTLALSRQWDSLLWDGVAQFYPWRELTHRSFSEHGEFSLWNPHQFCGTPFVGNGQSALFYPPHWLLRWLDTGRAMGLLNALHYFLAAFFTFLLIRVLGAGTASAALGAVTYAFGGFMVTWTELPSLIETATWLPGALLGVELIFRRRPLIGGVTLALALGLSLLAGHFQIAAYVWMVALGSGMAHLVWWFVGHRRNGERQQARPVVVLIVALVLGLGLGAVQLLPTLELGAMSPRGSETVSIDGFQFHLARAMLPVELLTIFDPDIIGSPVTMDYPAHRISYSEHCAYIGVAAAIGVLLALIVGYRRKIVWLFAVMGGLALWAAAGGWPAYIYYFYIPKVGLAGGFSRLLSVFILCAAVLAGLGCHAMQERARKRTDILAPGGTAVVWVLVAVALVQALPWAYRFNPRTPAAELYPRTELIDKLIEVAGEARVLAITDPEQWTLYGLPEAMLPPNSATVYGYYSINGYDSLFTNTYRQFANRLQQGIASPAANGNMVTVARPFAAVAAACDYYVSTQPLLSQDELSGSKRFSLVHSGPEGYVYRDGPAAVFPYAGRRLARSSPAQLPFSWQRATSRHLGANRAAIDFSADEPGPLRIAEDFYPGWIAHIDGRLQRPKLCDTTFMQLDVPAGEHHIELVYYPASVVVGGFLTLLALMMIVMVWAAVKMARQMHE